MELKEFISETVSSIIEAAQELQEKFQAIGAVINPPTHSQGVNLESFAEGHQLYSNRRVQSIEFDVAVTAQSSATSGGKAGLKIWVVEGSIDGAQVKSDEQVNRIKFSLPLSLPASPQELENRSKKMR